MQINQSSSYIKPSACRPLPSAICRKQTLCQGQALRAACAGLDMSRHASGAKYMRAMGGDGSAGGCRTWTLHKSKGRKAKGRNVKCVTRHLLYQRLQVGILSFSVFGYIIYADNRETIFLRKSNNLCQTRHSSVWIRQFT